MDSSIQYATLLEKIEKVVATQIKAQFEQFTNQSKSSEYLTKQETADFLKVSLSTVNRWIKKGTLKPKYIGSRVLLRVDEVVAYLESK